MTAPSLAEYAEICRDRLKGRMAQVAPAERANFDQQIARARVAMAISGLPKLSEDHLIGALFMSSAMGAAAQFLHMTGVIDHAVMDVIQMLATQQEHITIALRDGL